MSASSLAAAAAVRDAEGWVRIAPLGDHQNPR
jgi:hypothetical protein